jgi:crotonobetainyl-CoA:carnitine CoA-transferase CaiB-like acyl-CoA transferase
MGPLAGIKIVEMAEMVAIPGATLLLASQGATVVKVENTANGDNLRPFGSRKAGMGGWFANVNAGKRSIGVDLASPAGADVLWRLLDDADVFLQGFRPGVIDRLGFGADIVLDRHPRLVYVSSSGFGADGPWAGRPTYDPLIQAVTGWAAAQATADGPTLIRGMAADKVAALTTAQAVTAALLARATSGKGQHVQVSMLEANLAFQWPDVMMHCTLLDDDATHLPNLLGSYRLFRSSDGWVSVTAGNDGQWARCCEALERPELGTDERFATAPARGGNFVAWYAAFDEMVAAFPTAELLVRLAAADVPVAPVLEPADVIDNEQVVARGAVREVDHPVVGRMRMPRQGARFSDSGSAELTPAPLHCADTDTLLTELGFNADTIAALRASGAVK